jgi:flagella basal body P-ring formation protein FlgA
MRHSVTRSIVSLAAVVVSVGLSRPAHARTDMPALVSASEAVRRSIAARIGRPDADIAVLSIDVPRGSVALFRDAQPDPGARLGKPMRFMLRPASGRTVLAVVTATVIIEQAVLGRDIARGEAITADDIVRARGAITGVTLRHIPSAADLAGSRARRHLPSGTIVLPTQVVMRRAVEPGDTVTVVAVSGVVEVTAQLSAADGGDVGDLVRVVNRDTRRDLRARVIERGRVEVEHAR